MAKRGIRSEGTLLAEFRKSTSLPPPPKTLSNTASRLVNLLDEFLYSLHCGWDIPPGFPRDRFVPSVYGKRDLVDSIIQYLIDLGFSGDALRVQKAAKKFYLHRDWKLMTPSPGDDKGWKEFQERYVKPLWDKRSLLQGIIRELRQLIIDKGSEARINPVGDAKQGKKKRGRKKADYETIQQETKLANKWNQARQSGTAKLDFAKDNQVELTALDAKYGKRRPTVTKMLDALLDRVARRKRKTTSNAAD